MPLTFRWTPTGEAKQRTDELEGWKLLINICSGTGSLAEVTAVVTAQNHTGPTAINTNHPNYARWREAHKLLARRARRERQRRQRVNAAGLPQIGAVLPEQIDPTLNIRDTLRIAILHAPTSEANGTTIGNNAGQNINSLLQHLKEVLTAIEDELISRANHREDHDLRYHGRPPTQVFVASEWYFRPPGTAYSQVEHTTIINGLEELSRNFPDWLLIPGTIYWTPDNLANPTVRIFNQAPVLYAGEIILTRTKLNSHDIDPPNAYKERWGPDAPGALPAAITPASMQIGRFTHKGVNWCVDICRDHTVGEALNAYVNAGAVGADIYVMTSNGTTILDNFIPARHQGILIYCDGSGVGQCSVDNVNRPTPLNNPNMIADFTSYYNEFQLQKPHSLTLFHEDSENDARKRQPAFQSFKQRFDAVFVKKPSSDNALKTTIDGAVAAADKGNLQREEAARIEQILLGGQLPTGTAITPAEQTVMTQYAASLRLIATAHAGIVARNPNINNAKQAFNARSNATRNNINATIPIAGYPKLKLFQLIDRP